MDKIYIEGLRAYTDEGGSLSHINGMELLKQVEHLTDEIGKAYRAIHGFHNSHKKGELLDNTSYHSLTIAAANRFVISGSLDGVKHFTDKDVSELQTWLK